MSKEAKYLEQKEKVIFSVKVFIYSMIYAVIRAWFYDFSYPFSFLLGTALGLILFTWLIAAIIKRLPFIPTADLYEIKPYQRLYMKIWLIFAVLLLFGAYYESTP